MNHHIVLLVWIVVAAMAMASTYASVIGISQGVLIGPSGTVIIPPALIPGVGNPLEGSGIEGQYVHDPSGEGPEGQYVEEASNSSPEDSGSNDNGENGDPDDNGNDGEDDGQYKGEQ